MLISVGTMAIPCAAKALVDSSSSPLACSMQSVPAAAKSGALLVGGCHRGDNRLARPAGRQVAGLPIDPVTHELDPAIAPARLHPDVRDEFVGLDLVGVVADVAPGPGDVFAGPDDSWQVVPVVDPPGVGWAARVADEQGAGIPISGGLPLGNVGLDRAVVVQAHVTVGVDEAGQRPAPHGLDVVTGTGRSGIRHPPVEHPALRPRVRGSDQDLPHDVQHRRHGATVSSGQCLRAVDRAKRRKICVTTSGWSECTQCPASLTVTCVTRGNSARMGSASRSVM